mgnify:CR=1 FL=1
MIKERRMSMGMTQNALANILGVRRTTVSMWETGKSNPRAEMLPKLADLLKCTVDDLVRSKDAVSQFKK